MERISQDKIIRAMVDASDKSARSVSADLKRNDKYVFSATRKKEPAIGTVALIASAYGYDVALVNRETGEVDYTIEPPT